MTDINVNDLRAKADRLRDRTWYLDSIGTVLSNDAPIEANGNDPDAASFIAAANPTTILALLDDLAAMTERAENAERERELNAQRCLDAFGDIARALNERNAERDRAEKAERGLRILRECTVAERDRIYGDAMAKLRAELARRTVERDSHCEHANQESSRASDYAESNESLRTALARAEATIARLRKILSRPGIGDEYFRRRLDECEQEQRLRESQIPEAEAWLRATREEDAHG